MELPLSDKLKAIMSNQICELLKPEFLVPIIQQYPECLEEKNEDGLTLFDFATDLDLFSELDLFLENEEYEEEYEMFIEATGNEFVPAFMLIENPERPQELFYFINNIT